MKKRIIALSLILIMSLSGCGKENKGTDHMGNNNTVPGETIAEKTIAEKTTAEKTTAEKTTVSEIEKVCTGYRENICKEYIK